MRLYTAVTSSADEFNEITIDDDGDIHIHTGNSGSVVHTPYLTISLDMWDDLVTRVTALRKELPA